MLLPHFLAQDLIDLSFGAGPSDPAKHHGRCSFCAARPIKGEQSAPLGGVSEAGADCAPDCFDGASNGTNNTEGPALQCCQHSFKFGHAPELNIAIGARLCGVLQF